MDRLIEKIKKFMNPTVVGLDPKLAYIPNYMKKESLDSFGNTFKAAADCIVKFNMQIIDAICDVVPAVKPQMAYYELYGYDGILALYKTISYAKSKGMYVIVDGKRNDIGTTMEAYSRAYLGKTELFNGEKHSAFDGDSLTINGYLGSDGISPLLNDCLEYDKTIFVLMKTSNPSSGELQDRQFKDDESVYEHMGNMCEKWGKDTIGEYGYSKVGAVVGATYPDELRKLRLKFPHTFFLVPGYGAQGGSAEDVASAFKDGVGAIINSSRAVLCAWQKNNCEPSQFAEQARKEAIRMKNDIVARL